MRRAHFAWMLALAGCGEKPAAPSPRLFDVGVNEVVTFGAAGEGSAGPMFSLEGPPERRAGAVWRDVSGDHTWRLFGHWEEIEKGVLVHYEWEEIVGVVPGTGGTKKELLAAIPRTPPRLHRLESIGPYVIAGGGDSLVLPRICKWELAWRVVKDKATRDRMFSRREGKPLGDPSLLSD